MDWSRLDLDQLQNFLKMYQISSEDSKENLIQRASSLFQQLQNQPHAIYPEPVVDLYLATLYQNSPSQYTWSQILNLNESDQNALARFFSLDPSQTNFIVRLTRILRWIGALSSDCTLTSWRRFNPQTQICLDLRIPPAKLQEDFRSEISSAVIILFHRADAVKFAEFESDADQYDIFPPNFNSLSYLEKAQMFQDPAQSLNPLEWSRQQWPNNTLQYTLKNNLSLVYVQSDLVYCKYPSMYAEAMCGTIYFDYEHPEGLYYHFRGPQQSLFCVGEFSIADRLVESVPSHLSSRVFDQLTLRNDFEWARMSDTFRNDIYRRLLLGEPVADINSSYIYFPWSLFHNRRPNFRIQPTRIIIHESSRPQLGILFNQVVTYLDEIPFREIIPYFHERSVYLEAKGHPQKFKTTWHIPVSLIFEGPFGEFNVRRDLGVVEKRYISNEIDFDGTYNQPSIKVNEDQVSPELVQLVLSSLNLI